jgi:hypothetical protein
MGSLMKMSEYGINPDTPLDTEYDDEIMCAGWNPSIALAYQQQPIADSGRQMAMQAELSKADAELFLQKIYASMA